MYKTIKGRLKAICCTNVQVNELICPAFSREGSDSFERFGICLGRLELCRYYLRIYVNYQSKLTSSNYISNKIK